MSCSAGLQNTKHRYCVFIVAAAGRDEFEVVELLCDLVREMHGNCFRGAAVGGVWSAKGIDTGIVVSQLSTTDN